MSNQKLSYSGYVCAPYLHNIESLKLKEKWSSSTNVEKLYFAACTFSNESKLYFSNSANHYLIAKFRDGDEISSDLLTYNQEKTSFVFNMREDFFEREFNVNANFISAYYLEYGDNEDLHEIASLLLKRDKIYVAGLGFMDTFCSLPQKFTFPYSENIVVIEVSSEKSHQSVKKYCEQTRRDVNRKGLVMTNLMSLSILDNLK
ncbi:MAG: hypothetical protein KC483_06775 [Nitrosarchaeum sp.]|nr:hypothetical protein [Nitrosarchaeum sp.]